MVGGSKQTQQKGVAVDEVIGFSLSQEELLVALIIAELPAPVGYDDLEARVFGDLDENARSALLAAAERSMLARAFLEPQSGEPALPEIMQQLLGACTRPRLSWIVVHQPAGEPQRTSYFHQGESALVAHMDTDGIHQFLRLAGPQDIRAAVIELIAPGSGEQAESLSGSLPEPGFAAITNSGGRRDQDELRRRLLTAGWDAPAAEAFSATVEQLVSITAFARFNYAAQPPLERAFSIVRGTDQHWHVRLSAPETVELRLVDGPALLRGLSDFAHID